MREWANMNEVNLPIGFMLHAIRDKILKISVLRTFMHLKLTCSDRFIISGDFYTGSAMQLKITQKTFKSHINQLLLVNYLGFDAKSNTIYIRSIQKLIPECFRKIKYQVKVRQGDLNCFTEFVMAAAFSYQILINKRISRGKPALNNDGALQGFLKKRSLSYSSFAVSLSQIAKLLGRSISWVDKYKAQARKKGRIKVRHDYINTAFEAVHSKLFLKANPNIHPGQLRAYKGKLQVVSSDVIESYVKLIKRKKV
jgi:DNA-binding CsgD family transcriptional regulator